MDGRTDAHIDAHTDGRKRALVVLQLIAGPAVLGSYAYSFGRFPALVDAMWGGVPEAVRGVYTGWMFVAAAGYLTFTSVFVFRTEPSAVRVLGGSYGVLIPLYALVLIPSVLWMPLTGAMLEGPLPGLWPAIVVGLWLTLAGSLGLLAATLRTEPGWSPAWRVAAVGGAAVFCVQTVVLDAIVWVWLFEPPC